MASSSFNYKPPLPVANSAFKNGIEPHLLRKPGKRKTDKVFVFLAAVYINDYAYVAKHMNKINYKAKIHHPVFLHATTAYEQLYKLIFDDQPRELWNGLEDTKLLSYNDHKSFNRFHGDYLKMLQLLNLDLEEWIATVLSVPGGTSCLFQKMIIDRFVFDSYVKEKAPSTLLTKLKWYVDTIDANMKTDKNFEEGLVKLPMVPKTLLKKSEKLYERLYEQFGFDIHEPSFIGG